MNTDGTQMQINFSNPWLDAWRSASFALFHVSFDRDLSGNCTLLAYAIIVDKDVL